MKSSLFNACFIILILSLGSCKKGKQNTNSSSKIYGIDISHHQGKIDWSSVKEWNNHEIKFVYIKATEGATYQDSRYDYNIRQAQKHGFLVGSYHYFRTTSSVEEQFNNFKSATYNQTQDLIPLIDIEERKNWDDLEFDKNLKHFLELVEEEFNQKPMIYTVNTFYNKYLHGKYTNYHFLIGRYGSKEPWMKDGSNWTIWQFSESGKIDGIDKSVDIDVVNSKYSLEDFQLKK